MVTGRVVGDQYQAAWLCYINGLEIPVMSVETQFNIWEVPTAVLNLIPHPLIERIGQEDRLQVVLFYLDEFVEPTNPRFRLLGEFEVTGWSYSSTPLGRSIALNCGSHIQIFKQLYFAHLSAYKDKIIRKYKGQIVYEEGELEFFGELPTADVELDATLRQDASTLKTTKVTETREVVRAAEIKRPIDLVLHIFRSILNPVYTPNMKKTKAEAEKQKRTQGVLTELDQIAGIDAPSDTITQPHTSVIKKNFFARWLKMTGFHKRFIALPMFEEGIVSGGVFPILKETGGQKALTALKKYAGPRGENAWDMFMQIFIPMYMELAMVPSPPAVSVAKNVGSILGSKAKGTSEFQGLATFFIKPQCIFSLVPMCNVMFTSMVKSISFTESYLNQPTRVKVDIGRGGALASAISSGMGSLFSSIVQREIAGGFPWSVYKRVQRYMSAPGTNADNFLIFPEELFKGPVIKDLGVPAWFLRIQKIYSGLQTHSADAWKNVTKKEMLEFYTGPALGIQYTQEQVDSWDDKTWEEKARVLITLKRDANAGNVKVYTDTRSDANQKDPNNSLTVPQGEQALLAKYIQYEYFKARYEQRAASVELVGFDPFIVPGFPAIGFDAIVSGVHVIGYVGGVTHTWSAQSGSPTMSTSVNLMFSRTLTEHLKDNVPEPLSTVGKILQDTTQAKTFYSKLFFPGRAPSKAILYDFENTLIPANPTYNTSQPSPEYKDVFSNYGDAMRLVARPGCTLIEYIETWHGKDIQTLEDEGVLRGKRTSFYSSLQDPMPATGLGGAVFWDRIYKLIQGPGDDPGIKVTNVSKDSKASATGMGKAGWRPVDATHGNMAQTRNDWDSILEKYRNIVYSADGLLAPQE